MSTTSNVILVGGPDTGKTNFVGRLWIALQTGVCAIRASGTPAEIEYVESVVAHLNRGEFAPRTQQSPEAESGSVRIPLDLGESGIRELTALDIPDVSGEIWKRAAETNELPQGWMQRLERAYAALLFVRVLSDTNSSPLDWVTEPALMKHQGDGQQYVIPTQVMLCEFVRLLELKMPNRPDGEKPRLAVLVTAWDLLDEEQSAAGPRAYLGKEYPLFAGRLADSRRCEIRVFGVSILGGDLKGDEEFREKFLESGFDDAGYALFDEEAAVRRENDLTTPLAWVTGVHGQR